MVDWVFNIELLITFITSPPESFCINTSSDVTDSSCADSLTVEDKVTRQHQHATAVVLELKKKKKKNGCFWHPISYEPKALTKNTSRIGGCG